MQPAAFAGLLGSASFVGRDERRNLSGIETAPRLGSHDAHQIGHATNGGGARAERVSTINDCLW